MPTLTIPERDVTAAGYRGAGVALVSLQRREITVTLTSSEWDAKAGTGTLRWGFELSLDDGATWQFGGVDSAIGERVKGALMPSLVYRSDYLDGARIRLFLQPTVPIRLGLVGEVT